MASLLCIHGTGSRASHWAHQLNGLAGAANLAAIDLPGHGHSPGPSFQSVEDYAAWVAGFLATLPIRPFVMGHSLGGAICQMLALTRPELVSGLILVGAGCRLKVLPTILDGVRNNFENTVKLIISHAYASGADRGTLARAEQDLSQMDPLVIWGDFTACNGFDVCKRLPEIEAPVLCIVGDDDKLTPAKYSRLLVEALPTARMALIPGAGHFVMLEQPGAFNQTVREFVENL